MNPSHRSNASNGGLAGPFFIRPRTAAPGTLALLLLCAAAAASAGTLTVRDPDGVEWTVIENPADDRDDYLLKRALKDRKPDLAFGRGGSSEFGFGTDGDAPTMLRVEASRRVWLSGNTVSGGAPRPAIVRFNPDGSLDTAWGVQGKLEVNPGNDPTRAVDLMPLADGSVLVAGEAPRMGAPRAVVFKLRPDGTLDPRFGDAGLWHRPGNEPAAAVSLAVAGDGTVAVAVSVRGSNGNGKGEVWSLADTPPVLLDQTELDESVDEDELHIEWSAGHWIWVRAAGTGHLVEAATLVRPAASAPQDPGQGAFNPFAAGTGASGGAPAVAGTDVDDGPPWGWIGLVVLLVAGLAGVFLLRGRKR